MKIFPSNNYHPYVRSSFDVPTIDQKTRFFLSMKDDESHNLNMTFYAENGDKHEIFVSMHDMVRVIEAMKVLDPYRNA